ncbi:MAG: beta-lactamase family protein [Planctomycetes bacterium]|nr:beta-lactamase family protein [Planctomycetota bacterium]
MRPIATSPRVLIPLLLCSLGVAQELSGEISTRLERKLREDRIPGLSCAVAVGDDLVFARGIGLSDVENEVPASEHTVYRLASISKPITAVLAMQLVEEGQLDLDRDVHEIVPEWPEKRWPVTTRQLLGHLAGVRHYRGEGESTKRYPSQRRGLERFAADPLLHEPGSAYLYSTYGFNLAAAVVEALREQPFAQVVRERIAGPCGAPSLQDDDQRRIIPHRAQGYVLSRRLLQNSELMDSSYKLGGGGLCSSAPDLARFAQALMAGKLVSKQTLAQMWQTQRTAAGKATGYGLGFSVRQLDGELEVGHSGAQSRVSTMLVMLPERRIAVVVMCNLQRVRLGELARDLARLVRDREQR